MRNRCPPPFNESLRRRCLAISAMAHFLADVGSGGTASSHDPDAAPGEAKRRKTVLVVEDHRQSREALSSILSCMGFEPISATTLSQAERMLKSNPDFV